jgi:glycosyltransferase involved in cell wall biosynthesis
MTTSAAPKFSVVITNYNYANFIARAIDSVLSQDVEIELVVVDDCSTDNSRDIIRHMAIASFRFSRRKMSGTWRRF